MDESMQVDSVVPVAPAPEAPQAQPTPPAQPTDVPNSQPPLQAATSQPSQTFREIQVKVHVRRPERDNWVYLGKALVTQELSGHSSRVVVRSISTGKIVSVFGEGVDLQAEKRGNFVVISCVDGTRVVSWSLNALNNSDTVRLLASIELACYKAKQAVAEPRMHTKSRRRIERVIKDDRRKRHRRRKEQDAMVDLFARSTIAETDTPSMETTPTA
ncbi:hypothetical protein BD626DRAFT_505842 [Schizophyllum amplum]|uniref:Uncharacterized protein n=1 Tax=Schizophyllum amplum TaxID=97359 RepID=A0A550C622_9AGAR|nr:hypothetical protein BD626DRAFT_505842 [Auriculariopsis ampla]